MSRVHRFDSVSFGGRSWPAKGDPTKAPSGTITFSLTVPEEDARAFEEHVHAGWAVVLFLAWICRGCP